MKTTFDPSLFFRHFFKTIVTHRKATQFIHRHKVWKGLNKYGWFVKIITVVGLIVGLSAFLKVFNIIDAARVGTISETVQSMSMVAKDLWHESYEFFFMGSFKYIVMVVMEILLFHVTRRTIEIKTGRKLDTSFKSFIRAEKRMIKAVIAAFIMETIFSFIAKLFLGIFGLDMLGTIVAMLIQCYFLGFVMLDNYNELFDVSIRESEKICRAFAGVTVGIGLVTYILLLIPVIGAVVAPFVGAVTATLVMHDLKDEYLKVRAAEVEMV